MLTIAEGLFREGFEQGFRESFRESYIKSFKESYREVTGVEPREIDEAVLEKALEESLALSWKSALRKFRKKIHSEEYLEE